MVRIRPETSALASPIAYLTGDTTDYTAPVAVTEANTPTFLIGGSPELDVVAESFNLVAGNNVVYRNLINSESVLITSRESTASFSFEAPEISAGHDFFADVESHAGSTNLHISLIHGTTGGNIITFTCGQLQLTNISYSNSDDILMYNMDAVLLPSASGNDEFTILNT